MIGGNFEEAQAANPKLEVLQKTIANKEGAKAIKAGPI